MKILLRSALASMLLWAVGCNELATDNDNDGVVDALDCDDLNPNIFPGAPEICNGVDDDCDGEIDEGGGTGEDVPAWFEDRDGDGFGDPETAVRACTPPDGTVDNGDDCDDDDPEVNPSAAEDCTDGIDNDCDGEIDESVDEDGDGVSTCEGDCDDTDADIFPGREEICDGIDQDCDGTVDEGFADDDADGSAVCLDCDDDDPLRFPANPEICDDIDNDCDVLIDNDIDEDGDGFPNDCGAGGLVDILVVIDDSCSMEDEQAALAANAASLFEDLVEANADFNIAVITTTSPTFEVVVTPETPGAAAAFAAVVPQGNEGNNIERPFLRIVEALTTQPDWRRPGAGLSLLILSDEDDQSPLLGADFLAALAREVSALRYLKINHISGLAFGCTGDSGSAIPAPRLVAAGAFTDGDSQSICGLDWDLSAIIPDLLPVDCDDTNPDVFSGAPELCDTIDNNCDGQVDEDFDGDGLGVCDPQECDDTDPSVFSNAPELCDGIDNNCDDVVPESDLDGDGAFAGGCVSDEGLFEEDCDDSNPLVFPDAVEDCTDGLDNDCDGAVDTDLDGIDTDGDLYLQCEDCDDSDPNVFPGAPEVMSDGIDNDCDQLIDTFDTENVSVYSGGITFSDNAALLIPLSTPIVFCGATHDTLLVSSNGFVELSPDGGFFDQSPSVIEMGAEAPIAGVWADLDPSGGGEIQISTEADQIVVRWKDVPIFTTGGGNPTVDFDVRLGPGEASEIRIRRFDGGQIGDVVVGVACGPTSEVDLSAAGGACVPIPAGQGSAETFPTAPEVGILPFCPPQ
jgi:hypothetical protein